MLLMSRSDFWLFKLEVDFGLEQRRNVTPRDKQELLRQRIKEESCHANSVQVTNLKLIEIPWKCLIKKSWAKHFHAIRRSKDSR
jgi:hypothetical protein